MFVQVLIGLLILLGLVVAVVIVLASLRPSEFVISRSGMIHSSPEAVFPQINNFHNWQVWSPWAKKDPAAKNTYDGPPAGVGAGFGWNGNGNVGEGRMTIQESRPNEHIKIKLEFIRPMAGTNTVDFTLKPEGDQTKVTWTMSGRYAFPAKVFGLFMNMDKMIGDDFEQGLANIKSVVETSR